MNNSNKIIVFLGPDGVGKSSAINYYLNLHVTDNADPKIFHFRPNYVPNLGKLKLIFRKSSQYPGMKVTPQRHKATLLTEFIRFLILFCDLVIFRFNIKFYYYNKLLIFDRYFFDLLVDPLRYGIKNKSLIKILLKMAPNSSLNIIIIDTVDSILLRCTENERSTVYKLLDHYNNLELNGPTIVYQNTGDVNADHENLSLKIKQFVND